MIGIKSVGKNLKCDIYCLAVVLICSHKLMSSAYQLQLSLIPITVLIDILDFFIDKVLDILIIKKDMNKYENDSTMSSTTRLMLLNTKYFVNTKK